MNIKHNWKWRSEDEYHITYHSDYCGEVQVNRALRDYILEQERVLLKSHLKEKGYTTDFIDNIP